MSDYRNTPDTLIKICERCAAMVYWSSQTDHSEWHAAQDEELRRLWHFALGIEDELD